MYSKKGIILYILILLLITSGCSRKLEAKIVDRVEKMDMGSIYGTLNYF